ncbi:MAG: hypothetical protein H7174_07605 [Flavobacterium sp.]|nr:hypothetical protein [Flavobacterium sp.]
MYENQRRKILLFLLMFTIFQQTHAQDTISKKWKFAFQLDNRFSSIRNNEITIFGAKFGIQYKKLTRFGLGASFIVNPVTIEYFNKKLKTQETNTINFWYLSLFNDWILYKSNHWECFITEQIGYGKPKFSKEVNSNIVANVNIGLIVNEISGQADYKLNSWLGAGLGAGYRNILNQNTQLKNTFNAPIFIGKIIIYPEVFFK